MMLTAVSRCEQSGALKGKLVDVDTGSVLIDGTVDYITLQVKTPIREFVWVRPLDIIPPVK